MNVYISDTVYKAIDAVVAANNGVTEDRFLALCAQVAARDPQLAEELQDAALNYALDQTDAAFVLGYRAATKPAHRLFEPNDADDELPTTLQGAIDLALSDTLISAQDELYLQIRQIPCPQLKESIWASIVASWKNLSKGAFDLGITVVK